MISLHDIPKEDTRPQISNDMKLAMMGLRLRYPNMVFRLRLALGLGLENSTVRYELETIPPFLDYQEHTITGERWSQFTPRAFSHWISVAVMDGLTLEDFDWSYVTEILR